MYLVSFKWVKARCEEQKELDDWGIYPKNRCIYDNGIKCCEKDCELLKGVTKHDNSRDRVSG